MAAVRRKPSRKGKQVVNARKKEVDGITFASGLEAKMYTLLRDAGIEFVYEGTTYCIFEQEEYPAECFERATRRSKQMIDRRKVAPIRYTPDFICKNEDWIIECKGRANDRFPLVWKMFKSLMGKRKDAPILFKPATTADCQQVVNELIERGYGKKGKR